MEGIRPVAGVAPVLEVAYVGGSVGEGDSDGLYASEFIEFPLPGVHVTFRCCVHSVSCNVGKHGKICRLDTPYGFQNKK